MEIKEVPSRWVMLFLYSFSSACNGMMWVTVSPITSLVSSTYGINEIWVEMCSISFLLFYIPMVFPCNYIIDTYGLYIGILCGTFLTTMGSLVRIGAYYDYWFILAGTSFAAIGQPFLINSPAKIAATWFRPNMRTIATTIGTMFNFVGTAIGFFIPSLFVNRESKQEIANLMIAQAGICVIMCGIVTCLFKKKPEFPPSVSASQERELFWPAFKKVFQNRDYLLLVLAFSMSNGTLNVLATLIDLISKPYGFSTFDNSVFGTLLIASGIIGAVVLGGIVTVLKKYKKVCIFTCLGALVSLLLFIYTLEEKSMIITCFSISLLGLVLTPLQPISYEFGIELTYPIGEAMTGGILVCAGQIIGIIQIGLSYALQNQPIIIGFICMAGLGLGGIALAFARENLQRALIDHNSSLFISLQPNP